MWLTKLSCTLMTLALISGCAAGQGSGDGADYKLSGPYSYKNLTVFLVHGSEEVKVENVQTLEEAIRNKTAVVYETGDVGELEIENLSDVPVYIQSGDIVKGGRQDRMLRFDVLVAAKSGKVPIASFCVEQGRWTKRGAEAADYFETSSQVVAHKDVKIAAMARESQQEVWNKVADVNHKYAAYIRAGRAGETEYTTSLLLTQENDKVQENAKSYVDTLAPQIANATDAVGIVSVVNGKISSADIYRSSALFDKLRTRLLEAAALEALAESKGHDQPSALDANHVNEWLRRIDSGTCDNREIDSKVLITKKETSEAVGIESRENSASMGWIHKCIVTK